MIQFYLADHCCGEDSVWGSGWDSVEVQFEARVEVLRVSQHYSDQQFFLRNAKASEIRKRIVCPNRILFCPNVLDQNLLLTNRGGLHLHRKTKWNCFPNSIGQWICWVNSPTNRGLKDGQSFCQKIFYQKSFYQKSFYQKSFYQKLSGQVLARSKFWIPKLCLQSVSYRLDKRTANSWSCYTPKLIGFFRKATFCSRRVWSSGMHLVAHEL